MENCIFCQIITKKIPAKIVHESQKLVVFPDINPSADIHLLIVPKEHIDKVTDLSSAQADLLVEVYQTVQKLVQDYNLQDQLYRVVVNGGKAQHVKHLHFHFLGGNWKKMV